MNIKSPESDFTFGTFYHFRQRFQRVLFGRSNNQKLGTSKIKSRIRDVQVSFLSCAPSILKQPQVMPKS